MLAQGLGNALMLARVVGVDHAREQARILLERFGVESIEHVRIDAFARRLGVELVETEMAGARAQLVVSGDEAYILLPHDLTDPAERRWSIAHELGHFVLGHPARPARELCRPRLRRRRSDRRHQEDEANGFASALLVPDRLLSTHCDVRPMTLEAPLQLATLCGVPWAQSAQRMMEVSWRTCAVVISHRGRMVGVWPSLPFLLLCAGRMWRDDPLAPGSLARRFFDTGQPCGAPALVPSSAWLDGASDEVQIQEHSVVMHDVVITMLWDATESDVPRPIEAHLRAMAVFRDQLLGEMEENPSLVRAAA